MKLLDLRQDLRWSAARVARVTGADAIDALRLAQQGRRIQASMVASRVDGSDAELLAAEGRTIATLPRGQTRRIGIGGRRGQPRQWRIGAVRSIWSNRSSTAGKSVPIVAAVRAQHKVLGVRTQFSSRRVSIRIGTALLIRWRATAAAVLTRIGSPARLQLQISGPTAIGAQHAGVSGKKDYSCARAQLSR